MERRGKENDGAEPIKATDSKAKGCSRALKGAGATLASVAGVGRGLMPMWGITRASENLLFFGKGCLQCCPQG